MLEQAVLPAIKGLPLTEAAHRVASCGFSPETLMEAAERLEEYSDVLLLAHDLSAYDRRSYFDYVFGPSS
jgi:hypothetical protein